MRQDQYKRVLETRILPQLEEWFPDDAEYIFMHDSTPCHKVRRITAFLAEKNHCFALVGELPLHESYREPVGAY